eukprot:gnl/TRDRNA2_/TRDRNA2_95026_c1_seq1.p1 gnl/TRDRNA2_/TRDRNA2_95026_c1~~gnl/TRDRNA2_/TRDRNA2_95026_c1_seq1.p1  ORF type:complete len:160 (-),score=19.30 gnl/TRDRNA2_/TRDRNA2_95026_c1_seq1:451-930(-)
MMCSGASLILCGAALSKSLKTFGESGHTRLALSAAFTNLCIWATAGSLKDIHVAQVFDIFGMTPGAGTGSMLTTLAVARDMGKGEIAAAIQNQGTLTKVLGPIVYAHLFANFGQGPPFLLAASFIASAFLLFSTSLGQQAAAEARSLGKAAPEKSKAIA